MSKHYFYFRRDEEWLENALLERVEEEGGDKSGTIKYLLTLGLGASDAREDVKRLKGDDHTELVAQSIYMPLDWWEEANLLAFEAEMKTAAWIREQFRVILGKPLPPPKPPRAKRDPKLSSDIIIEAQAEMYNDMRNLRSSEKGIVTLPVHERIRANPLEMFLVNLCRVPGCRNEDIGLHKHAGNQLADYADAIEAGGRT